MPNYSTLGILRQNNISHFTSYTLNFTPNFAFVKYLLIYIFTSGFIYYINYYILRQVNYILSSLLHFTSIITFHGGTRMLFKKILKEYMLFEKNFNVIYEKHKNFVWGNKKRFACIETQRRRRRRPLEGCTDFLVRLALPFV